MIVDIGASTTDVSICKFSSPIITYEGAMGIYAGNYCDAMIAAKAFNIDIMDLLNNPKEFTDLLKDAKDIKETKDQRKIEKKQLIFHYNEQQITITNQFMTEITDKFIDDIFEIIKKSIDKFEELQTAKATIHHFLICGGMGSYNFGNFKKKLFNKCKNEYQVIFKNCMILEDPGKTVLSDSISLGAAMLAKDQSLVVENLNYDVGIVAKVRNQDIYSGKEFYFIKHDSKIGQMKEINIEDSIRNALGVNNIRITVGSSKVSNEEGIQNIPFDVIFKKKEWKYPKIKKMEFAPAIPVFYLEKGKNVVREFELVLILDENGIIQFEIRAKDDIKIKANAIFKEVSDEGDDGILVDIGG